MNRKSLKDFKEALLRETAYILATEGPEGVSMRKVASKVDISAAGIYKLFRNKEDLMLESAKYASLEFKKKVLSMTDIREILRETMRHSTTNKWIIRYLAMRDPSFTKSIFKDIIEHLEKLTGNKPKARVLFRLASMQGMIGGEEEEEIIWRLIDYILDSE